MSHDTITVRNLHDSGTVLRLMVPAPGFNQGVGGSAQLSQPGLTCNSPGSTAPGSISRLSQWSIVRLIVPNSWMDWGPQSLASGPPRALPVWQLASLGSEGKRSLLIPLCHTSFIRRLGLTHTQGGGRRGLHKCVNTGIESVKRINGRSFLVWNILALWWGTEERMEYCCGLEDSLKGEAS